LNTLKYDIKILLLIAFSLFVSHFLFLNKFGLYEDDYYNIPPYLNASAGDLYEVIKVNLTNWLQGRPLSFIPYVFSALGFSVAGIPGLYVIAFLINAINGFLVFLILKYLFPDLGVFVLSGTLMFCLFPSDTTKTLLIHSFLYQMSVMFFLTACYLYLKNYKLASYLSVLLCLFSFESMFMLFFAVPFLQKNKSSAFKKNYLFHSLILVLFLFLSFLYRKLSGETRVEDFSGNIADAVIKSALSFIAGPFMNFYLVLRAPAAALKNIDLQMFVIMSVSFVLLFIVFRKLKTAGNNEVKSGIFSSEFTALKFKFSFTASENVISLIRLFPAAILFISLGYVLSFTHFPPTAVSGRLTSVHIPAAFGVSMLFALSSGLIMEILQTQIQKTILKSILCFYFSLLIGYGLLIQYDFVKSWDVQKNFWTDIIKLCPDMNDNTLIILENEKKKLPSTGYILSNSWADPVVLQRIFRFPAKWKNPPRLFVLNKDFESRTTVINDTLKWKVPEYTFFSEYETLKDSSLIMLKTDDSGNIYRINEPLMRFKCRDVIIKPAGMNELNLIEKNKLYDLLIKN